MKELFRTALDHERGERAAFLDRTCDDPRLRHEVESLLASLEDAETFLETPAGELAAALLGDARESLVGLRLGQYEVLDLLGEGGMGTVYLARDTKLGRRAALKLLPSELRADEARVRRLTQEAIAASSLNHPNILTVYDVDEVEGIHYIAAEYIEGETLRARLGRGPLPVNEALMLGVQVGDALSSAHAAGILHRDVKPENVMLRPDGYAKLLDFGLAKVAKPVLTPRQTAPPPGTLQTGAGTLMGTPHYMSPEQVTGLAVDPRTDVWSLAVVLYEMLAGRRPFPGESATEVLHAIVHQPATPLPATVPEPLQRVVQRALEKDPQARFDSMDGFVGELRRMRREGEETTAANATTDDRLQTGWRRSAVAAVLVVTAAAGALLLFRGMSPESGRPEYVPLTNFADAATSPALSPDGRSLAFIRGESTFYGPGQIYVKRLPDGELVQLTSDDADKMNPRFSPDGRRVAYATLRGLHWETWVVSAAGGEPPRPLLMNAEGLTWITAIAGAPRVLFSEMTGRDVQMAIMTSAEDRADARVVYMPEVTGMAHRSYLSPDGRQVLIVEMDYSSWLPCRLVPVDGSSRGTIVGPAPSQCTDAAWSPDGHWMYFSADTGSGFHIWRQPSAGGAVEQVTSGVTEEEGIAVDPDGRSFVTSIGTRQSTVWVRDSRGERQVTSEGYGFLPSIGTGGRLLYYLARAPGGRHFNRGELWAADLKSGARRRLLPQFMMQSYQVSLDGRRVLFVAAEDTGRSSLWLASLDGPGQSRRLVDDGVLQAAFGSAGTVLFAAAEPGSNVIYRMHEDGSARQKLVQASNLVSVSADGRSFAVWEPGATAETSNAVRVYSIDGGPGTLICGICSQPGTFEYASWAPDVSWSPDGRFLYLYIDRSTYAIPLKPNQILPPLPRQGVSTKQDVAILPGASLVAEAGVFVGPDPSIYAFTKVTTHRNIYRVRLP